MDIVIAVSLGIIISFLIREGKEYIRKKREREEAAENARLWREKLTKEKEEYGAIGYHAAMDAWELPDGSYKFRQ